MLLNSMSQRRLRLLRAKDSWSTVGEISLASTSATKNKRLTNDAFFFSFFFLNDRRIWNFHEIERIYSSWLITFSSFGSCYFQFLHMGVHFTFDRIEPFSLPLRHFIWRGIVWGIVFAWRRISSVPGLASLPFFNFFFSAFPFLECSCSLFCIEEPTVDASVVLCGFQKLSLEMLGPVLDIDGWRFSTEAARGCWMVVALDVNSWGFASAAAGDCWMVVALDVDGSGFATASPEGCWMVVRSAIKSWSVCRSKSAHSCPEHTVILRHWGHLICCSSTKFYDE